MAEWGLTRLKGQRRAGKGNVRLKKLVADLALDNAILKNEVRLK